MLGMSEFGTHLKVCLTEACKRVGASPNNIDFNKAGWYRDYTWTKVEANDYVEWMTDYLYNNTEARKELMTITSKHKGRCKSTAEFFSNMYLWTFSD